MVARNDCIGGRQDGLGGAVVLLEHDRASARVVALELLDVADGRTAEGVDRLIGITDHAQLTCRQGRRIDPDELLDEHVLRVVGVLILVDHDVPETATVVLGNIREELKQGNRAGDQVIEVEGIRALQTSLILAVRLGECLLHLIRGASGVCLVIDELVLEVRHLGQEAARGEPLGVEIKIANDHGHQSQGILLVVDREAAGDAEARGFGTQDAHAGTVEGRDPHRLGPRPDQLGYSLLHLAGGLVREGDGQDLARLRITGGEQMSHATREHASLARTGARHDQQRGAAMLDGSTLGVVEIVNERRSHLGIVGNGPDRPAMRSRAGIRLIGKNLTIADPSPLMTIRPLRP